MGLDWKPIGVRDPGSLGVERVVVHYAALILGSVAWARLPRLEDESQTNLGSSGPEGRLVTHPLDDESGCTLELDVPRLELIVASDGVARDSLPLTGRTMREALEWAARLTASEESGKSAIQPRTYPDFPESDLARSGSFPDGSRAAREEIARWFENAGAVLGAVTRDERAASPVRTWPHHFDIGSLIDLGDGKSIGVGMSPGDGNHDEPYFYAYAHPTPPPEKLDALSPDFGPAGRWTTTGYTGALLPGSEIAAQDDPARTTLLFLERAIAFCREALI